MTARRLPPLLVTLSWAAASWAVLSLLPSCGDRHEGRPPGLPDLGPPRWMATNEDVGPLTNALAVTAGAPCRLSIRFEGGDTLKTDVDSRLLVAGESVRFTWTTHTEPPDVNSAVPPASEAAEGRTEAWTPVISFGFSGQAVNQRRPVIWARPGKGRILPAADAVPPGSPQEIPFGSDLEVVALAVADVAAGEARLVRNDGVARIRLPPRSPGDRARVVRLILHFERL